jgi:hypothetical protein
MTGAEILAILTGIQATMALIQAEVARAKERGEWTPEQEAAFDSKLKEMESQPYWQRTD